MSFFTKYIFPKWRHIVALFVLSFSFAFVHGKQTEIDSLFNVLKNEKYDTAKVDLIIEICWEYQDLGEYAKGLEVVKQALEISKKINYIPGLAEYHNRSAEIYRLQGNYQRALEVHYQALQISEKANYIKGKAKAYKNIGVINFHQNELDKALENYLISEKFFAEFDSDKGVSDCHSNIGNVYYLRKQYDEALRYYTSSIALKRKINDTRGISAVSLYVGILYRDLAKDSLLSGNKKIADTLFEKALTYFNESMLLCQQTGYRKGIADSYNNIGELFLTRGNPKEALSQFNLGLSEAIAIGTKEYIMNSYSGLYRTYEALKDAGKALLSYKNHIAYRDSLINEKNAKKTVQMEMQFQFDRKEAEVKLEQEKKDALAHEEKVKQRLILMGTGVGLILVLVIALLIFRALRVTRKKNIIIEEQKVKVELQNIEIEKQKALLEERQEEIIDSINYAKRIQYALLANDELMSSNLQGNLASDFFVFFKPKDIVSGDFYWAAQKQNSFFLAVCDSTGHGVPGAFMSLLNISFLSEAVNEKRIDNPNEVFDFVRGRLEDSISKEGAKDGMDGILLRMDKPFMNKDKTRIGFAAANNAPVLIKNGAVETLSNDKMPVGSGDRKEKFKYYEIVAEKGDSIYLFTDGYADQFGGDKGKKFKSSRLKDLLFLVHKEDMETQKFLIEKTFEEWKGTHEQIDDVCVVGIRV